MKDFLKKHDILGWSMAICGALLLWIYVITIQNPETTVNKTVQLQVVGANELSRAELNIIGDISPTVTLQLRGRRDKIAQLTTKESANGSVVALLNLASIYKPGDYNLGYTVNVDIDGVSVVQKSPAQIAVSVDKTTSKTIPVELKLSGQLAEGYEFIKYGLDKDQITITGPQRYVDEVSKAVATAKIADITDESEQELSIILLDSEGTAIDNEHLSTDIKATVFNAKVQKIGSVPTKIQIIPNDVITSDMIEYTISPVSIELRGEGVALEAIKEIDLGEISISKCLESNTFEYVLPIKLPEGVTTEVTSLAATVSIKIKGMIEKTFEIPKERFLPVEGYNFTSENINVTLLVKEEDADKITAEDIIITPVYSATEFEDGNLTETGVSISSSKYSVVAVGKYKLGVEKITE